MLGVSGLFTSSGDCAAEEAGGGAGSGNEGGNVGAGEVAAPASSSGGFSEDDNNNNKGRSEDGDRSFFSGNRWPRQETLALLKIRSDMDLSFRDATHKGPLWEDISRKLGEMGYQRSGKKCKEKFENVYKYHKRTKEGRASRPDAKTYRFFDQLEALDSQPPAAMCFGVLPPPQRTQNFPTAPPLHHINHVTVPSQQPPNQPPPLNHATMITMASTSTLPSVNLSFPPQGLAQLPLHASFLAHRPSVPSSSRPVTSSPMVASDSSSSSSTSSDKDIRGRRKRKRKWKDFFDRLLNEVLVKQEELQRKFLEAIEKREQERIVREEAWKMQEMARLNREHEILVQERTLAAAKDAAVIAFLQKMTAGGGQLQQQQTTIPVHVSAGTSQSNQVPSQPHPEPTAAAETAIVLRKNEDNSGIAAPSRWPKTEVQALINLRTRLETKYQESGPKGPLWEEISAEMRSLGYSRSSKRCKEKWENINKYFKKVKESNRRRPEDSKTCPYFQQLDELYREKSKGGIVPSSSLTFSAADYIVGMKPPAENNNTTSAVQLQPLLLPPPPSALMIRPEQNWPILPAAVGQTMGGDEIGSENAEAAEPLDDDEEGDDEELDEEDEEEEEEEENSYSILTNKHTQA